MIRGITFASQRTFSADFAHFQNVLMGASGITKGCAITNTDGEISVSEGYFFIAGREVAIVGSETITVPDRLGTDLYCKIVFEIDLTKTNTMTVFNQGYFKTLISETAYVEETQEDLDAGGTLYQMPFATYMLTATGVEDFVDLRPIMTVSETWQKMAQYTQRLVNGQQITDTATGEVYNLSVTNGLLKYEKADGSGAFGFAVLEETTNITVFNADGSITTTYEDGRAEDTVFNADGSITTTSSFNGETTKTATTVFNTDGSITTTYEEGGSEE